MQLTVNIDQQQARKSLRWAHNFFGQFDTSMVHWLRIDQGNSKYEGVYGRCQMPTKKRAGFRISCHLPGPFPCDIVTRKSPLYQRPDGSFPKAPKGCRRGLLCVTSSGKTWYRVVSKTKAHTLDEALVWIVAHEAFHFLRHTRQVPGRNTEIDADRFADEQLTAFQITCPPARRPQIQLCWPWSLLKRRA